MITDEIARKNVERLNSIYGLNVQVFMRSQISRKNVVAYHTYNEFTNQHTINMSAVFMQDAYENGFCDYKADDVVVAKFSGHPAGEWAVQAIIAHEYAHALSCDAKQAHGIEWKVRYAEVLNAII